MMIESVHAALILDVSMTASQNKCKNIRKQMTQNVKQIYMDHNIMAINTSNYRSHHNNNQQPSDAKIMSFTDDITNPIPTKQYIFPDFSLSLDMRTNIIKEVIKYVKNQSILKSNIIKPIFLFLPVPYQPTITQTLYINPYVLMDFVPSML